MWMLKKVYNLKNVVESKQDVAQNTNIQCIF